MRQESLQPVDTNNWYSTVAKPLARQRSFFRLSVGAACLGGLIAVLNYHAPTPLSLDERAYASLIIVAVGFSTLLWTWGYDALIPFMPLLCTFYALDYGVPVFLFRSSSNLSVSPSYSTPQIERALGYVLAGIVAMLVGYYGPLLRLIRPVIPRFRLRWPNLPAVRVTGLAMGAVGFVFGLGLDRSFRGGLAQLGGYVSDLFTVGICILLALWLSGMARRWIAVAVFALFIPARLALGLASGLAGSAVYLLFTLLLLYAAVRRRIWWSVILIGTIALLLYRPFETPYRDATWRGPLVGASLGQKVEYMGGLMLKAYESVGFQLETIVEISAARLAQFTVLAEVVRDTPSQVPYWGGVTYYPLLFKPIPRFLWPNKPEEVTGQEFGHRYGLLDADDPGTSLNLPQLVELYANFGPVGLVLGMIFFGLFYRVLMEMFVHPGMGFGSLVAAVFLASNSFDIGSATSSVVGGIPWCLIFIAAVHFTIIAVSAQFDSITNMHSEALRA